MINKIKQAFPNPKQSMYGFQSFSDGAPNHNTCYCVGGAFLLFRHGIRCEKELSSLSPDAELRSIRFPTLEKLADGICRFNNKINYFEARSLARSIVDANDVGKFNEAWNLLEFATSTNGEAVPVYIS